MVKNRLASFLLATCFLFILQLLLTACGETNTNSTKTSGLQPTATAVSFTPTPIPPTATPVPPTPTATPVPPTPTPTPKPVIIGLISTRSGPLAYYGDMLEKGLSAGLAYYTKNTNKIGNREVKVFIEDDAGDPARAAAAARRLVQNNQADFLVGATSNAAALAIAEVNDKELKKIFLVEIADTLALTGDKFSRYTFRTASNLDQQAAAIKFLLGQVDSSKPEVAHIYRENPDGQETNLAWSNAVTAASSETPVKWTEYPLPPTFLEFTTSIQKAVSAEADILLVSWQGAKVDALERLFRQLNSSRAYSNFWVVGSFGELANLQLMTDQAINFRNVLPYWYQFPTSAENDFLVKYYQDKYKTVPDLYSAGSFSLASAIYSALSRSGGNLATEQLISAMEGMSFTSPKGKMIFRKEDHQALQTIYLTRMAKDTTGKFGFVVPLLLKEFSPEESAPPIRKK